MDRYFIICMFLLTFITCIAQSPYQKIPVAIIDNRPFVETIVGNDTLHFMIDCGAVSVIDMTEAKKLKLNGGIAYEEEGAGEGKSTVYHTTAVQIKIGQLIFKDQPLLAISLLEIKEKMNLPYLDGLIGYDLFADSIIRIDYKDNYFQFMPAYTPDGTDGIPFTLYRDQIPLVQANIFDTTAHFILDTGDRSDLTINTTFAANMHLASRYDLSDTLISGYGLGGPVYAQTFYLQKLITWRMEFDNITCRIPTGQTGGFARDDFDGSVGGGMLKNKILTINYKTHKIYIE